MNDLVLRVAAKAVIANDNGAVLILREANTYDEGTQTGKWGLPGGRLNSGEAYTDGIIREAKEETGLDVDPLYPVYVGEWRPVIKGVPHQIIAVFTVCKAFNLDVKLSDEHDKFAWVKLADLDNYVFMSPDRNVLAQYSRISFN
jgi:8-oxo-dGTP diphosphatase